jgi:Cell division protein CrgA
MPKSKSKRRRPHPPPQKKHKPSPPWFGGLILAFFGLGVALIVLNYLGLVPFTSLDPSNWFLFGGLGGIALGFILATQWH